MLAGSLEYETKLDKKGLDNGLSKIKSSTIAVGNVMSQAFIKAGQIAVSAIATVGKAVIKLGKEALTSYADYEQLVGGVDTLFKNSSKKVQEYASKAYKTAGLSANQYMNQVTSFSASLLQSLGNDTSKAADYANRAVIDMADNANKMRNTG